jgi:transcription factor SPN1
MSSADEPTAVKAIGQLEDDDSELSEVDEEQFKEDIIPIDESVFKIGSHKKKGSAAGKEKKPAAPKKTKRKSAARGSRRSPSKDSDDGLREDNEDEGQVNDEDDADLDPETRERREWERKLDEAMKPSKKRARADGVDLEQMQDEKLAALREEMRNAFYADCESIKNGEPAVRKLQLLPEVADVLRKHNLADSIVDNNLLEVVRLWLEPLPDASLPGYEIQKELFAALEWLPIKTIHLRESGLGKVVLFYAKSKRPQPQIKRIADKLIGNWTRPIMGRSDNYRDKRVIERNYDADEVLASAPNALAQPADADPTAIRRKNRAAIPTVRPVTFDVAPVSRLSGAGRPMLDSSTQVRRMKQRLTMQARASHTSRKSGVSIEGKELRH